MITSPVSWDANVSTGINGRMNPPVYIDELSHTIETVSPILRHIDQISHIQ
jgi:hypothetical protein